MITSIYMQQMLIGVIKFVYEKMIKNFFLKYDKIVLTALC